MDYADSVDVEKVYPIPSELAPYVPGLLAQASRKLKVRVPDADVILLGPDLLQVELLQDAVVNAVVRVLKNWDSARQWSQGVGPFTKSVTVDAAVSTGLLYIDEGDLSGLLTTGTVLSVRSARLHPGLA